MQRGGGKIRAIEAALELINADLRTMPLLQVVALARRFQQSFGGLNTELMNLSEASSSSSPKTREIVLKNFYERLVLYQGTIRDFFEKFMRRVSEDEAYRDVYRQLVGAWTFVRPLAEIQPQVTLTWSLEFMPEAKAKETIFDAMKKSWDRTWPLQSRGKYLIRVNSAGADPCSKILYDFVNAFDGLPLAAIHRCEFEKCGRWFLHLTKKTRRFCSDRCRAREGSRIAYDEVRANKGEKYEETKKAGRSRAKKSYDKKVRKESGHNVKIGKGKEK